MVRRRLLRKTCLMGEEGEIRWRAHITNPENRIQEYSVKMDFRANKRERSGHMLQLRVASAIIYVSFVLEIIVNPITPGQSKCGRGSHSVPSQVSPGASTNREDEQVGGLSAVNAGAFNEGPWRHNEA